MIEQSHDYHPILCLIPPSYLPQILQLDQSLTKTNRLRGWRRIFFGVRARILAWYVVLMAFSTLVSILAIRQVLVVRLEEQVEKSFVQEVEEFRRLTKGRNPTTAQPFGDDIAAIFRVFLSRNIPDDHEVFIALLDGQLYQSSPEALPVGLQPNSAMVKHWAKLTQPERGKKVIPTDTINYLAEPVLKGKTRGVFVVAHFTAVFI